MLPLSYIPAMQGKLERQCPASQETTSFPPREQRELRRLIARDLAARTISVARSVTVATVCIWALVSGFIMLGMGTLGPEFSRVDLAESILWALTAWMPLPTYFTVCQLHAEAPRLAIQENIDADLARRYRPHASVDCEQQWAPHSQVQDNALAVQCLAYRRDTQHQSGYARRAGTKGEWALKIERQIIVDNNDPDQAIQAWEHMSVLAAEREADYIAASEEQERHIQEAHALAAALRSY